MGQEAREKARDAPGCMATAAGCVGISDLHESATDAITQAPSLITRDCQHRKLTLHLGQGIQVQVHPAG